LVGPDCAWRTGSVLVSSFYLTNGQGGLPLRGLVPRRRKILLRRQGPLRGRLQEPAERRVWYSVFTLMAGAGPWRDDRNVEAEGQWFDDDDRWDRKSPTNNSTRFPSADDQEPVGTSLARLMRKQSKVADPRLMDWAGSRGGERCSGCSMMLRAVSATCVAKRRRLWLTAISKPRTVWSSFGTGSTIGTPRFCWPILGSRKPRRPRARCRSRSLPGQRDALHGPRDGVGDM
jgi:hypothetical protein